MSSYGYMPYYKTPSAGPSRLAAAASKDPYGLAPNNRSGPLGVGSDSGFAAPAAAAAKTAAPISPTDPRIAASNAANPLAAGANGGLFAGTGVPGPAPSAAAVNKYDLNTDPALQNIKALVGMSNSDAQSAALKQRQDLVLAYGDKGVASAVLGASDPIAAAAGQNPTSTVAQLGQSRDRNLKSLDNQLNADNLSYSGYRVTQEQQAGQDYQNALAQAAGGLNTNLDQVGSNLAAALAGNNGQIVQGINAAADRANANATATGTDPGAGGAGGASTGPGAIVPATADPTDAANEAASLAAAAAAGGGAASGAVGVQGAAAPGVGMTNVARLYQLLGRKTDPRLGL